jgi:hypothetical protein
MPLLNLQEVQKGYPFSNRDRFNADEAVETSALKDILAG